MKKFLLIGLALIVVLGGFVYFRLRTANLSPSSILKPQNLIRENKNVQDVRVIATGLDTPWGIVFLPDNSMLVTERQGTVRFIDSQGNLDPNPIATIEDVNEISEGGLLGIDIHPDFKNNNYVYFYYTYSSEGNNTLNRVVRMAFKDKTLSDEQIVVDKIPGAPNHNGGRIKFGPDGRLYIGTGDAQEPSLAQNRDSLAGKILRVTDEGKVPADNPFGNPVYSYGHRNVQGLAWNSNKDLWVTEHGPSANDELNSIRPGNNYGWPIIQGNQTQSALISPAATSGAEETWAPAGTAFIDNSLFFAGLRGQTLYEAVIENGKVADLKEHFNSAFGRLRDVIVGPDGLIYVTTSNKDGRGIPAANDDRIIRINPEKL